MDFYQIRIKEKKDGPLQLYPDWIVGRSQDLMVRGKSFYAIWDEKAGLWSTDEYDVQRLVDEELYRYNDDNGGGYQVLDLKAFATNSWGSFRKYLQNVSDNNHPLDETLVFANTEVKKSDYASRRLPYSLEPGTHDAWDEIVTTLYAQEERDKIEWAIGAIVAGDSKKIQKFLVFYGPAGSGKSTILNIVQKLFQGYVTTFDAKALGSSNNAFATEVFKSNPLVAIQHDGDLSRIEDNTKLNSIISHEDMPMNEKYKPTYSARTNAFLLMGTNQPVKISDAKSGLIRRLIDVHPTGVKIDTERYHTLMANIDFELGAIAHHCLERYRTLGKSYYSSYRPLEMMLHTDVFYNYVEFCFDIFKAQNGVTLKQAYELYKEFGSETGIDKLLPQYKFREELRNYFEDFLDRTEIDGVQVRSYYLGFKNLTTPNPFKPDEKYELSLNKIESNFDHLYSDQPAQYAREDNGVPGKAWDRNTTTLSELDTSKKHWVKVPRHHIVIDFDMVDANGDKDIDRNVSEAAKWPPTYTEVSQSGAGIHLHYFYTGDVAELSGIYSEGIEVKTLLGGQALRRRLTLCNNLEIATISSGLPKKEKPMLEHKSIHSEKGLRELIERNLRKEFHPGTKPSVDFIKKILDEAYESGMGYDLTDMRPIILTFAAKSSNQAPLAMKAVQQMKFASDHEISEPEAVEESALVFFDVEVYSNLFVVCWKYAGLPEVVRMINPEPHEIEKLFMYRLVGFNNRRYDNHILYARFLGYTNEELYALSQKIISNTTGNSHLFGEAYNLSYADIYDFSSKKQGLKRFMIDLGIHKMEMDISWDEPVNDEDVQRVVDYCANDVIGTEVVFESRRQDFVARQILAELSGLSVNHTTQAHTAKIIFGDEKRPQDRFVYTDLSKEFPGYEFNLNQSSYKGENPSEGGYVYAEPGIYENVAVLDVASMHPTSTLALNLFGPYTEKYRELIEARLAIKRKDEKALGSLLGGRLAKFTQGDSSDLDSLSYALKIVINIVYGLTSAKFPNAFKDNRNIDNIVAKRGALFMIDLKHAVQEQGFTVAHIKTDSIKIPGATPDIIQFVTEFGKKYGYDFEHENTYDKFCLVNDAVYIAREGDKWTAVGAQFQHPYVFKSLFSCEQITFDDLCETKNVTQGTMWLDFNEDENNTIKPLVHVGRTGSFVPVREGGGFLWRIKDDNRYAVTGTKGYRWIEREMAPDQAKKYEDFVDYTYFDKLIRDAEAAIEFYGSFEKFAS